MRDADARKVREWLAEAACVAVLTGAGVSAESRIPTFRSTPEELARMGEKKDHESMRALWARFDPATLATPAAFERDPETVSRWYDWRRLKCLRAEPNPGHRSLAHLERTIAERGGRFGLITQNVDGLHQRAGSGAAAGPVIELHGSIHEWRGVRTGRVFPVSPKPFERFPPRFSDGEIARPGVVWFGEMLPADAVGAAAAVTDACDLFLTIGTSAEVYPAAGFIGRAKDAGARTVEINPQATAATDGVDIALRGPSGEILPLVVQPDA